MAAQVTTAVPPDDPVIEEGASVSVIAGKPKNVTCRANNGKPAATLTWWKDGQAARAANLLSGRAQLDNISVPEIFKTSGYLITAGRGGIDQWEHQLVSVCLPAAPDELWTRQETSGPCNHEKLIVKDNLKSSDMIAAQMVVNTYTTGNCFLLREKVTLKEITEGITYITEDAGEKRENGVSVLTLNPSVDDHGKVLTCRSTNPAMDSNKETTTQLNVEHTPVVVVQSNPPLVEEGSSVSLSCESRANPGEVSYQWKKDGVVLAGETGQVLRLTNVRREDNMQVFTCDATNAVGTNSANLTLSVQSGLRVRQGHVLVGVFFFSCIMTELCPGLDLDPITRHNRWKVVRVGLFSFKEAVFESEEGSLPPTNWVDKFDKSHRSGLGPEKLFFTLCTLQISPFVAPIEGRGIRVCGKDITNICTLQEVPINLKTYGPEIVKTTGQVIVDRGTSAALVCKWSGNPSPTIMWTKKGSSSVLGTGDTLSFPIVDQSHSGTYVCTAVVPGSGEDSREVVLVVNGPPIISSFEVQYASSGAEGQIECLSSNSPPPSRMAWTWNGVMLDSGTEGRFTAEQRDVHGGRLSVLTISKVQASDFAEYNCTVWNRLGLMSKIITLRQKGGERSK
ncbi:Kin of IRRE-like protein 3, partial [Branchiostoma belcheri]